MATPFPSAASSPRVKSRSIAKAAATMGERAYPERSAAEWLPKLPTLPNLREAARGCRGCDLYKRATQTVFGEGRRGARLMLIGEQPGDKEDVAGRPFVGPAGGLLDKALAEAGIPRDDVYVTNAVKHFKWEPRGKRRIHKKPNAMEIAACRPWLDAELDQVRPEVIVCLGATAAQAILGKSFKLTQHRGEFVPSPIAPYVLATVHPSSILRSPDDETRHRETARFVDEMKMIARVLRQPSRGPEKRAA